jgi:MFS family permease
MDAANPDPEHVGARDDTHMHWADIWPVLILAVANVCSFADRQLTAILAVPIQESLHLDHASMALLGGTAFATFYGLAAVPAGFAADRFNRRYLICGAIAFWSICTAVIGLSGNFYGMFWARVGVGVGEAVLLPCAFSMIRDLSPSSRHGLAFSLFGLGIPLGMGSGLLAGGVLNTAFAEHPETITVLGSLAAWQKTFLVLACLGIPVVALALFLPEPSRYRPLGQDIRPAPSLRRATLFYISVACAGLLVQGVSFWIPTLLMKAMGLSTAQVGLRLGLLTIVSSILGMFALGLLADSLNRRWGLRGTCFVYGAGLATFVAAAVLLASGSAIAMWGGAALFFFLAMGFTSVASSLALHIGRSTQAGLMGALYGLVVNVAGHGLGPLSYGWAQDRMVFSSGTILLILTTCLALIGAFAGLAIGFVGRRATR